MGQKCLTEYDRKAMSEEDVPEFWSWLQVGIDQGWCSNVVCSTHDGLPMTEEEMEEWDDGYDPCIYGVRMWS